MAKVISLGVSCNKYHLFGKFTDEGFENSKTYVYHGFITSK